MTWPSIGTGTGACGVGDDLRALLQHDLRIDGSSPTSCLRSGFSMSGRVSERLPTKSGFALPIMPAKPEVVRRHRAVGLLADDDVALLGAQHMHRLGAVGRDAEALARGDDRLPDRRGRARAGTLISKPSSPVKLTRKSRVGTPQILPSRTLICGIASADRSMPSTSGAITSRACGPCTAITAHCSVVEVSQTFEVGELGLEIVLHVMEDARRAAGRRRDMEAVRRRGGRRRRRP